MKCGAPVYRVVRGSWRRGSGERANAGKIGKAGVGGEGDARGFYGAPKAMRAECYMKEKKLFWC